LEQKKLLPKFVYTIYGLPMMIMPLREFDKMESAVKQQMTKTLDLKGLQQIRTMEKKTLS
jgi:hypothetical protein